MHTLQGLHESLYAIHGLWEDLHLQLLWPEQPNTRVLLLPPWAEWAEVGVCVCLCVCVFVCVCVCVYVGVHSVLYQARAVVLRQVLVIVIPNQFENVHIGLPCF